MSLSSTLWNKNISASRLSLIKRGGEHAGFVKQLWEEPNFRHHYNRLQNIHADINQLANDLDKEKAADVRRTRSSHWVITGPNQLAQGVLSLVDISDTHRRAELLVGVSQQAPQGTALSAVLICFQLFFHELHYDKLLSFIYPDNVHSLKSTLALGFKQEGFLRQHLVDPSTGKRHDVIQTGLLKTEAFSDRNKKLAKKLLG